MGYLRAKCRRFAAVALRNAPAGAVPRTPFLTAAENSPLYRQSQKGTRAAARIPFFLLMARSGVRAAGGEGRPLPGDGETEQSTCQGDKAPQIYGVAPSEPFCKKGDAAAGEGAADIGDGIQQAGNVILMAPLLLLYIFCNKQMKVAFIGNGIK